MGLVAVLIVGSGRLGHSRETRLIFRLEHTSAVSVLLLNPPVTGLRATLSVFNHKAYHLRHLEVNGPREGDVRETRAVPRREAAARIYTMTRLKTSTPAMMLIIFALGGLIFGQATAGLHINMTAAAAPSLQLRTVGLSLEAQLLEACSSAKPTLVLISGDYPQYLTTRMN